LDGISQPVGIECLLCFSVQHMFDHNGIVKRELRYDTNHRMIMSTLGT